MGSLMSPLSLRPGPGSLILGGVGVHAEGEGFLQGTGCWVGEIAREAPPFSN